MALFNIQRPKWIPRWVNIPLLIFVVFVVVLLIKFPQNVVLVVFSLYILFGLLAVLYRAFRGIKIEK